MVKLSNVRNCRSLAVSLLAAVVVFWLFSTGAQGFPYTQISQFGSKGTGAGQFEDPAAVAVDESTHDVYVADAANHRIQKFGASGAFIAAWGWGVANGASEGQVCTSTCRAGESGTGPGELGRPVVVAVDNSNGSSAGDVYVGDEANDVVEKFQASGSYLSSLSHGWSGPFGSIYGVAVDASGNLWVYDSTGEIYEFNSNNSEIQQWNTGYGVRPGLAVDSRDDVYVVRWSGNVEKFTSSGAELGELDQNSINVSGLTSDLASDQVFADQRTQVAKYNGEAKTPSVPDTTFGGGILQNGSGLGNDSKTGNVYVADVTTDEIQIFGPPLPGAPEIEEVNVTNVGAESANLNAVIYTGQLDSTYRFEYGTSAAYGQSIPVTAADIGSGIESLGLHQSLIALAPNTTYQYRVVATNADGVTVSPNHSFTTFSGADSVLPDTRVYELVSPPDKNGGDLGIFGQIDAQASVEGEAIAYGSLSSFSTSQSAELVSEYISRRTSGGWETEGISPPTNPAAQAKLSLSYLAFTTNLSAGVLTWPDPLVNGASIEANNLYVRDDATGSYQLVTMAMPPKGNEVTFVGGSANYSHIVFQAYEEFTQNAAPNARNVYEWADGKVSLVSIPPKKTVGAPGAGAGNGGENLSGAVSADGSLIFWTDGEGQLYVREQGTTSIKLNTSQRTPSAGDGTADFYGATPDGSVAFFTDETPLTNGSTDKGGLYAVETATGHLTDLTPTAGGNPDVQDVIGFGENGSSVYFVATGNLASGATPGEMNLYVSHAGVVAFIATLSSSDSANDWTGELASRYAEVSEDGEHLVFLSVNDLTGYDNRDPVSNQPYSEVFEYDRNTARLHCVSCNPTGEQPIGTVTVPRRVNASYRPRYVSEDGSRVFFDSADGLTSTDVNGTQDVYEWERGHGCSSAGGCIYLISSGATTDEALFADASSDGKDVFFATSAALVPQDTDEAIDMYDAREGGGFLPVPLSTSACSGEACQGPLHPQPIFEAPQTLSTFLDTTTASTTSQPQKGGFTVTFNSKRAMEEVLRKGRVRLTVHTPEPTAIDVKMSAEIKGRMLRVASRSTASRAAGSLELYIPLTKVARDQFLRHHALNVAIAVTFSKGHAPIHVEAALSEKR